MKGDQPADRWCGHVWPPGTVEGWTQVRDAGLLQQQDRADLVMTGTSAHGSTVPTALGDLDDRR